jgi:hypothetical protein
MVQKPGRKVVDPSTREYSCAVWRNPSPSSCWSGCIAVQIGRARREDLGFEVLQQLTAADSVSSRFAGSAGRSVLIVTDPGYCGTGWLAGVPPPSRCR